jgi:hypothetical protein
LNFINLFILILYILTFFVFNYFFLNSLLFLIDFLAPNSTAQGTVRPLPGPAERVRGLLRRRVSRLPLRHAQLLAELQAALGDRRVWLCWSEVAFFRVFLLFIVFTKKKNNKYKFTATESHGTPAIAPWRKVWFNQEIKEKIIYQINKVVIK